MRKAMMFVILILFLTGCAEATESAPRHEGVQNLNSLVGPIKINDYFIGHNKYWKSCWKHEDKIWDEAKGYELEPEHENYYISEVSDNYEYKHKIYKKADGSYEMKVKIDCEYTVYVRINAFSVSEEERSYDGGTVHFNMDITETDGYYVLNSMKAYKQTFGK